jgi:hypothetical protein
MGLQVVTAMDFEGQPANHLAFRLAHVILMPEAVPASAIRVPVSASSVAIRVKEEI